MKDAWVTVNRGKVAAGLIGLVESLDPSDLPAIERAYRSLSGLHAVLTQLLAPGAAASAHPLAEAVVRLEAELAEQKRLNESLAERIVAQSQLLSKAAERVTSARPDLVVPGPDGFAAVVLTADANGERPAVPQEPPGDSIVRVDPEAIAADHTQHLIDAATADREGDDITRRALRLIADHAGLPVWRLAKMLGLGKFSTEELLRDRPLWFAVPRDLRAMVQLTDAGRAALAQLGGAPAAPIAECGITIRNPQSAIPESSPNGRPELPRGERQRLQAKLVAEALAESAGALDPYELAKATGLPLENVRKRLKQFGPGGLDAAPRYFMRSAKDGDLWMLTNSGEALAKEPQPGN